MLHPRVAYSKDRRIVLCHATENSRLMLACATESTLESSCSFAYKTAHSDDFGQVAFAIEARAAQPIDLTKYMVYHTSQTASAGELCGRAEWTLDRVAMWQYKGGDDGVLAGYPNEVPGFGKVDTSVILFPTLNDFLNKVCAQLITIEQ